MIIKLNTDGSLEIQPQTVPEVSSNIFVSYIFPKGLNYLTPVLYWGDELFRGNNIRINKHIDTATIEKDKMKVILFDGDIVFKTYELRLPVKPLIYIGYNVEQVNKDIIKYIEQLEEENKLLKELGDIV